MLDSITFLTLLQAFHSKISSFYCYYQSGAVKSVCILFRVLHFY